MDLPEYESSLRTFVCEENSTFPNNSTLKLLIYSQVFTNDHPSLLDMLERRFNENMWPVAWRNGLYEMHHYHSTAHEVLGIYAGWVRACFGGPGGVEATVSAGDVIVIPAGVSHKNLAQSTDFRVVGAYPKGQQWNMRYGQESERPQADEEISRVEIPTFDPVYGQGGPLIRLWGQ